tara:strand:+ start:360148 stop:361914 length:1767 start_codon:yes stop_codon:yes gene_type:complete
MTTYQNFWNVEIETLLDQLGNPIGLHENIVDTIQNSGRTGIYINQVLNALRIGVAIKNDNQNIAFVASMQSGKSGTVYFLCNYVLPAIGVISEYEHILFVTSMRDRDLYEQNRVNLEKDAYDCVIKDSKPSVVKVMKMSDFFNHPNPHKVVKDFKVKLVVRDEDQYGSGLESSFELAFFSQLRQELPDIKLLAVSATPYDILDAHFTGTTEVELIEGVRSEGYFGITEMLNEGLIEDIPQNYRPVQPQEIKGETVFNLHPKTLEYAKYLLNFDNGLGIIRESNTNRAIELRNLLNKELRSNDVDCLVIGSDTSCDFSINEGLAEVRSLVQNRGRKVILIIVQALSAGKDLKSLKEHVRFGIEPRDRQLANGAQGITGRFCGYHNNRDFKLLASLPLLEHYAQFEQDPEIFMDTNWRNELYNNNIRGLSTQTKFRAGYKEGVFTPVTQIVTLSVDELNNASGRIELNFLDDEAYERLKNFFSEAVYNGKTRGVRLNASDVTIRLASSYNQSSNRVYRNWNCNVADDFGNIFFKKNQYKYGILISNYPIEDERNTLGFTGIKILHSGTAEWRSQETNVQNNSMYGSGDAA